MAGDIVLISDFGTLDGYFSAMRGAILSYNDELRVHDGPHNIPSYSLSSASYILHTLVWVYPPGTVIVCVVDPGVGSSRRELIAEIDGRYIVAPDNSLITLPAAMADSASFFRASEAALADIRSSNRYGAVTFDGRDLFSPLAARIAANGLEAVAGEPVEPDRDTRLLPVPGLEAATGHVLHVDHFGNLVSNIRLDASHEGFATFGEVSSPVLQTFSSVDVGEALAYRGSYGFLEMAVREGNAFLELGIGILDPVRFDPSSGQPTKEPL